MIRALILDIDGVMVGEKIGYNSPYPHPDVTTRLAKIRSTDIPVILCTAKPHYSILPIIESAKLDNVHIAYAGAVIIDPLSDTVIETHPMRKNIAQDLLTAFLHRDLYTELYALNDYYVLRRQVNDLTRIHTHILQHDPILVDSLELVAASADIYKIMPVVADESGMPAVNAILDPFKDSVEVTWSMHPIAMPRQFCGVAEKGISKRQAVITSLRHLGIDPADTLGVGDSLSDWKFMDLCGYTATLENGQDTLKTLVGNRKGNGFIGGHVDDNGILGIFDHFGLPSSS